MNFEEQLRRYADRAEGYLHTCFHYPEEPQQILFESMRYSLLAGGKRIRPVLVQAFCDLCGGDSTAALPFGAAVEMVHTYSLIHDDLPCMDNDDFRRGKPTNHRVYGEANAVLAGDALLTAAFGQLAGAQLPAAQIVEGVRVLSRCAGELGMVGGQVLDLSAESRVCTATEVTDIQSRKTGALISAACQLGVIAAGGSAAQQQAAADYAEAVGLAFQIADDVLDVVGDARKLGKATGMDGNKNTFVRLYGVETCRRMIDAETRRAIAALEIFGAAPFLTALAQMLARRDH
ncbi:MAG: polyprenyl synthetase family protein [Oscillospiraceae bacterium]|nr:polyprenyl synthetase family protein [Oscillospiraceae bacterium]